MFFDSSESISGGSRTSAEAFVPHGHSLDPFACPCCANALSESLRLAGVDLRDHAAELRSAPPKVAEAEGPPPKRSAVGDSVSSGSQQQCSF